MPNVSTLIESADSASGYNFFNTEFAQNARSKLTTYEKEKYDKMGQYMYKNFDMINSEDNTKPEDLTPMDEALIYVEEALNSGLHVSELEKDEIVLLQDEYGKEWYKRWLFEESDLKK